MEFESPERSAEHQALIQEVAKAGFETTPLRRLLWLINAHPNLVGHGRVLTNVLAHLESDIFQTSSLGWAADWKSDLTEWLRVCRWIADNRHQLELQPELLSFNRHVQGKHPLVGEGVERHGVPAALWSTHETCKSYPLNAGAVTRSAEAYFELQGHLLASYAECRFKSSTLQAYESYCGEAERPVAPSRTGIVGLAIRELSHNKYADFLCQLPTAVSTVDFAKRLNHALTPPQSVELDVMEDAQRHFMVLRRYFHRFIRVLSGWQPSQVVKSGYVGRGGGGRAWRHGFIHVPGPIGVYLQKQVNSDDDPDAPKASETNVFVNLDSEYANDPIAVEESGLSPDETLEDVFLLYSPEEMKGLQQAARSRHLAAESRAQSLPFDYSKLTSQELQDINALAT